MQGTGAVVLAVVLLALALVLYWALTNALVTRLLQLHGALMTLHRLHPSARVLTFLPLKLLVVVARYAVWWLALRRGMSRVFRGR